MAIELVRLRLWEELFGDLKGLSAIEDNHLTSIEECFVAHIGKANLILPAGLEPELKPLLGQKICALRTDNPERPYLFRMVSNDD